MRQQIKEEKGIPYLYVCVNPKIDYAFISKTGKSLVFRIDGTYIKSNGEIVGSNGSLTGYISHKLNWQVEVHPQHFGRHNIINHDFGDNVMFTALKIQLISYKK